MSKMFIIEYMLCRSYLSLFLNFSQPPAEPTMDGSLGFDSSGENYYYNTNESREHVRLFL